MLICVFLTFVLLELQHTRLALKLYLAFGVHRSEITKLLAHLLTLKTCCFLN